MIEFWFYTNTILLFALCMISVIGADGKYEKHWYILLLGVTQATIASWAGLWVVIN